jgi:AraC-like DNA-binding protein
VSPESPDSFRYRAATPEAECWGAVVTGCGRYLAPPGRPYPPPGHPADHSFTWEGGRVMGSFQVVYVERGEGELETEAGGRCRVGEGTAMLLHPGAWHRYRPAPGTGWLEKWVELGGPLVRRLVEKGVLDPLRPAVAVSRRLDWEARLDSLQRLFSAEPCAHARELAAHVADLLALVHESQEGPGAGRAAMSFVDKARRIMEDAEGAPRPVPEIARSLGVSYSHFRRQFRRSTGISPRQYQLRIRLQRAQRLLGATGDTLKEISERLGFSSPFHLSSSFKAAFGVCPSSWRRQGGGR